MLNIIRAGEFFIFDNFATLRRIRCAGIGASARVQLKLEKPEVPVGLRDKFSFERTANEEAMYVRLAIGCFVPVLTDYRCAVRIYYCTSMWGRLTVRLMRVLHHRGGWLSFVICVLNVRSCALYTR